MGNGQMPKGIGLTLVICGSLYALYSLITAVTTLLGSAMTGMFDSMSKIAGQSGEMPDMSAMTDFMSGVYKVQGIEHLVTMLISVIAIIAGVGIMKYTDWARKISLVWAASAFVFIVVDIIIQVTYVMPLTAEFTERMMQMSSEISGSGINISGMGGLMGSMQMIGVVISSLVLLVLPVMVIIFALKSD